jgi:hypothetical protein
VDPTAGLDDMEHTELTPRSPAATASYAHCTCHVLSAVVPCAMLFCDSLYHREARDEARFTLTRHSLWLQGPGQLPTCRINCGAGVKAYGGVEAWFRHSWHCMELHEPAAFAG